MAEFFAERISNDQENERSKIILDINSIDLTPRVNRYAVVDQFKSDIKRLFHKADITAIIIEKR